MAYNRTFWLDHVTSPPNRYKMVSNTDGTITLTPAGTIIQQGTNMSAVNFNNMEEGIFAGQTTAIEAIRAARIAQQKAEGLEGVEILATLTNTLQFPFNNSQKTIPLPFNRNTKTYTIYVEILSVSGGGLGDITISDRLLNGFKLAHSGAATTVEVRCIVQGGM